MTITAGAYIPASDSGSWTFRQRNRPGQAVIQTYQPEHYSIQAAAIQDYKKFYKEEMGYRMLLDYPPAAHMMTVFGACQDEELLKMPCII